MRVYRFENEQGLGPWSVAGARAGHDAYDNAHGLGPHHSCGKMPSLMSGRERGSKAHEHYKAKGTDGMLFGFVTLDQIKDAFPCPTGRTAMATAGYRLSVYEVEPSGVLRGHAQCIFKREVATLTGHRDLRTLKLQPLEA